MKDADPLIFKNIKRKAMKHSKKNRMLLTGMSGIVLIILTMSFHPPQQKIKRPNILFALADDASWRYFSAYGCKWISTPAFDRVAKQGILFNNAYTPNAKCAPSRACILTGRNSWQLEAAGNHAAYFPAKFKTYAEALGEHGYFVGSVAKGWSPGEPGSINGKERELTGPKYDKFTLTPPTTGISNIDYPKNFEAFLAAKPANEPFCFWYGSHEPHRSYEYKSGINKGGKNTGYIDKVPPFWPDVDTVRSDMLDYAYEVEYFDNQLAKMLKILEENGELENTIVVVTADNGMPFPNIKGQVYEYSNHLPLAIMWPKGIKNPGRVVDDFVNFIDFAPTFLELAGIDYKNAGMQPVTGISLTDILYSNKAGTINPKRNFELVGKERHDVGRPNDEGYPVRGLLKDGFLYLHNFKPDRWPVGNPEAGYPNVDGSPTKTYMLNTRRIYGDMQYWQPAFGKRPELELYNIKDDPYCIKNLAGEIKYAAIIKKMDNEMTGKLKQQKDPRMFGKGDVFDHYPYAGPVRDFYNRLMKGEKVKANWINESDKDKDLMKK